MVEIEVHRLGVFSSFTNATTTGCGGVYPQNIEYCSRGEGIYYDLNMLQESLDLVGGMGRPLSFRMPWVATSRGSSTGPHG